jgi:hypothetical protein
MKTKKNNNITKKNIIRITKKSKKNKKFLNNNVINLKKIFSEPESLLNNLNNLFKNIENKEMYNHYKNTFKPFSKEKMGKSGAFLGFIENNKIIKFNEISKGKKTISVYQNCVSLLYNLNEMLINLILSNLKYFIKNKNEIKKITTISPYILKIESCGIKDNNTFFIMKKIGVSYKDKIYTNLNEIFINNYIPNLLTCVKKNDTHTINQFCQFLSEMLSNYFDILKFLNKNLGFIHTDCKTLNIFVNKNNKYIKKYKLLKKEGFIINYIPLVADLDKSTLNLQIENKQSKRTQSKNKTNTRKLSKFKSANVKSKKNSKTKLNDNNTSLIFLPYNEEPFKTNISKMFGFDFIYHTRFLCNSDRKKVCKIFKSYHYDRLTVIFELYCLIYKFIEIPGNKDCYSSFHIFNKNVSKFLEINESQTELIYKTIKQSILIRNAKSLSLGFHINKVIGNYCRNIR